MKTADFKYTTSGNGTIFGKVTLKDDGKVSISLLHAWGHKHSDKYKAKAFGKMIAKGEFKDPACFNVREDNVGLLEILRNETQSLKIQFIAKTKEYAKTSFKHMSVEIKKSIEEWYKRFDVETRIVTPRYPDEPTRIEPVAKEYHRKNLYKMRAQMDDYKQTVGLGYEKYEASEVKHAEIHYENSLRKLALRIEAKGLLIDKLKVETAHIGVNITTTLTDGILTVRAWTIIAEGPIQRPHYRYLVK